MFIAVAISWTSAEERALSEGFPLDLNKCVLKCLLPTMTNTNRTKFFSRTLTLEASEERRQESIFSYLDWGIFSKASNTFQNAYLSMTFDSANYNLLSGQSRKIKDYSEALKQRVQFLYKQSWIGQYFDYTIQSYNDYDEGNDGDNDSVYNPNIVMFTLKNKILLKDVRFSIYMHIPEKTKKFFLPKQDWESLLGDWNKQNFIPVEILSLQKNGFITTPYPYAQSQIYKPPFFILLKSPPINQTNFLGFVNFTKSNTDACVLSLLNYDPDNDMFQSKFSLVISFVNTKMLLTNVLEFILVDSRKNVIEIEDNSQLFVCIEIVKN